MMTPSSEPRRVLLSTTKGEHPRCAALLAELAALGMSTRVCTSACDAATLRAAVRDCDVFVALVTHGYLDDAAMREQVEIAGAELDQRGAPHLFVFWIEHLRLPEAWKRLRAAEALSMKPSKAARRVQIGRGKRPVVVHRVMPPPPPYTPRRVLAELGAGPLEASAELPCALRVLFLPSFHPECVVDIAWDEASGHVCLRSLCTNLQHWDIVSAGLHPELDVPAPSPWCERASLTRAALQRWRSLVADVELASLTDASALGLDGMRVELTYVADSLRVRASCWSPARGSRHHRVVAGACELARAALRHETSATLLRPPASSVEGYPPSSSRAVSAKVSSSAREAPARERIARSRRTDAIMRPSCSSLGPFARPRRGRLASAAAKNASMRAKKACSQRSSSGTSSTASMPALEIRQPRGSPASRGA